MATVSSAACPDQWQWRRGGAACGGAVVATVAGTPATGTRIAASCRHRAATLLVLATTPPPATSHQPHLCWPTLVLTPSLHFKLHFKLSPHYTISRLNGGQHTCSQAPVNTLLSVQKYDVCVGELNYWYLERCKDAEQRSSEDMSQGDSSNWNHHLTTDWCLAGAQLGRCTQILGTRVVRLTTNYYTQPHTTQMNIESQEIF